MKCGKEMTVDTEDVENVCEVCEKKMRDDMK